MSLPYQAAVERYGHKYVGYADFFRQQALVIDEHPNVILQYLNHPALQEILNDNNSNAVYRTQLLEALGYGDPGVALACPGPSLSGLIMRELGTNQQIADFFQFLKVEKARTFFALTEPLKGSDAAALQTMLSYEPQTNSYYLNGEKCLFGNGAVGKIGVVLARLQPGPLGIRAILITPDMLLPERGWIERENLMMTGLRGAQIAYMRFNNCPVKLENILGNHMRPMENGMMAVIKTFNRLRTGVGALAIGQAQAVLDYCYQNKKNWHQTENNLYQNLYYKLSVVRLQLLKGAEQIDLNPFASQQIAIAKVQAGNLAEEVMSSVVLMLGPYVFLENEWLAKCYRDCFAWEYMEGTSNMQYKHIFAEVQKSSH
jgi:acyl-CoA dehydrogenase